MPITIKTNVQAFRKSDGTYMSFDMVSGGGGDTSALEQAVRELQGDIVEIDSRLDDLEYVPLELKSYSNSVSVMELGAPAVSGTVSWEFNKAPQSLSIGDVTIGRPEKAGNMPVTVPSNTNRNTTKSWLLDATDERGVSVSRSTSVSYCNGFYYGAAAQPAEINKAFVSGLTKKLTNSTTQTVTVVADGTKYIWICAPRGIGGGNMTFTVGGFSGGFSLVSSFEFENAYGFKEEYCVWRSDNAGLGSTTVNVR